MSLVALIASMTADTFAAWQSWSRQNQAASDAEALAEAQRLHDSDVAARAEYDGYKSDVAGIKAKQAERQG